MGDFEFRSDENFAKGDRDLDFAREIRIVEAVVVFQKFVRDDFLVLPADPYMASPDTIRDMKPDMTISGGKPVYCSTEWECRNQ